MLIKKEMAFHESGGTGGKYLDIDLNYFTSIPPISVAAERSFSAAGYFESHLADETLNMLFTNVFKLFSEISYYPCGIPKLPGSSRTTIFYFRKQRLRIYYRDCSP